MPIPAIAAMAARVGSAVARGAEMGKSLFRGGAPRAVPRPPRRPPPARTGTPPGGARGGRGGASPPPSGGGKAKHGPGGAPADRAARDDEGDKKLNKLWRIDTTWNLAQRVNGLIAENVHSFTHNISVAVVGGPMADLRRCWYLALSAAFGRYRRRVQGIGEANLEAVWDVTGKSVHVSIGYVNAGTANLISEAKNETQLQTGSDVLAVLTTGGSVAVPVFGGLLADFVKIGAGEVNRNLPQGGRGVVLVGGIELLQVGPDQVTVGGGWPNWLINTPTLAIFNPLWNIVGLALSIAAPPLTERGVIWSNVNDDCLNDTISTVKFTRDPLIELFKELPVVDPDGIRCPWGMVSPINIAATGLFSKRGNNTVNGPTLPDDGRLITSGEKRDARVQPPRPGIDGKSRESLVQLMVASLHQPCFAPPFVGCQPGPIGSQGIRVYPAGKGYEGNQFQRAWQSVRNPELLNPTIPAKNMPRLTG